MDVPGSIGECCAGQFYEGRNLQLRNCHKCAECNGIVHMICGEPVQGADLVTCFKCLADTKPKSTSESINRQMIVCAAGDRCRCPSQWLGVDIDICDMSVTRWVINNVLLPQVIVIQFVFYAMTPLVMTSHMIQCLIS